MHVVIVWTVKDGLQDAQGIEWRKRLLMAHEEHAASADPLQSLYDLCDAADKFAVPDHLKGVNAIQLFEVCTVSEVESGFRRRLLLDSRVVDLLMAYNPTFVMLSFLKPLFFNSLKNEFRFSDNAGA